MLLKIHRLMTEGTMENSEDAGRFRLNDDVVVEDGITHEIVHTPPSYKDIPDFIEHLCDFLMKNVQKYLSILLSVELLYISCWLICTPLLMVTDVLQELYSIGIC